MNPYNYNPLALEQCFKQLAYNIGLDKFDVSTWLESNSPHIRVSLNTSVPYINYLDNVEELMVKIFEPLVKSVQESPAVKVVLRDLRAENEELKSKVKSAEAQIEELMKYKNYYDLAYGLQHKD